MQKRKQPNEHASGHQNKRIQAKRTFLLDSKNWTEAELDYKTFVHVLPSDAAVEEYQKKILAEAANERNSKTLMASIVGVNEKLLRTWEKRFAEKAAAAAPSLPAASPSLSPAALATALESGSPIPTLLPESLRSWPALFAAYKTRKGHLVCFRRAAVPGAAVALQDRWELYADPELSPNFQGVEWNIERWNTWFVEMQQQPPASIARLLYLVDVELPNHVEEELLQRNSFMRLLSDTGPLCLNGYLTAMEPLITRPPMGCKLYLAPTLVPGGSLLTPPHFDGHGTMTATHTHLFGSGYNLVQIWPLDVSQDQYFRQVVGLPASEAIQRLPHEATFAFDTAPSVWHSEKDAQLQNHYGIRSRTVQLHAAHTILLQSGRPHTFKKVVELPLPIGAAAGAGAAPASAMEEEAHDAIAASSSVSVPLAGFAGDISYLGHSPDVVIPQLYKLVAGHRRLRLLKQPVYCFWQLALWCLVDLYDSLRTTSELVEIHLRAAVPYLEEMLDEEDQYFRALGVDPLQVANNETLVMEHEDLADEYICTSCRVCLWNLVIEPASNNSSSTAAPLHLCGPCALEKRSKKSTFHFRFGVPPKLRAQLQTRKQQLSLL